jgi:hypothetical protein
MAERLFALSPTTERSCQMFTAHAKTAEEVGFQGLPHSPGEDGEFRSLERTAKTLAENEQWLAHNADKVLPTSEYGIAPTSEYAPNIRAVLVKEDEYVLRCLGAAVMIRWSTLPAKLQRELFDHASSLGKFDQDNSISPFGRRARCSPSPPDVGQIARTVSAWASLSRNNHPAQSDCLD